MRALPLAHLVGYDAADPDDRDHQPVRERPLIQLDAEALYSLKNRTRWFGTPHRGGGARATRAVVC